MHSRSWHVWAPPTTKLTKTKEGLSRILQAVLEGSPVRPFNATGEKQPLSAQGSPDDEAKPAAFVQPTKMWQRSSLQVDAATQNESRPSLLEDSLVVGALETRTYPSLVQIASESSRINVKQLLIGVRDFKFREPTKFLILQAALISTCIPEERVSVSSYLVVVKRVFETRGLGDLELLLLCCLRGKPTLAELIQSLTLLSLNPGFQISSFLQEPFATILSKQKAAELSRQRSLPRTDRSVQDLAAAYSDQNQTPVPPHDEQRRRTIRICEKIESLAEFMSTADLYLICDDLRSKPILTQDEDVITTSVATMRELIYRRYRIRPYTTQVSAVVLLLLGSETEMKGCLGRMLTGEGKSTVIAMLIGCLGLAGHHIDVVTSAKILATRDATKYAPFLNDFGLSCGHICHEQRDPEHFDNQVLFGTNSDFEFAFLFDGIGDLRNHERGCLRVSTSGDGRRPFDVVIVDEVDCLLIDKATQPAIIANTTRDRYFFLVDHIHRVVVNAKDQMVQQNLRSLLNHYLSEDLTESNVDNSALNLEQLCGKVADRVLEFEDEENQELLNSLSREKLQAWVMSCLRVHFSMTEDVQYIVRDNEIVIVDHGGTGELNEGCRWQNRLHQFAEKKHGLTVNEERMTKASVSHISYFSMYKRIMGLTGTLGGSAERAEVQEGYKVSTFDVPSHRPSRREKFDPLVVENDEAFLSAIANEIAALAPRPILIILPTIKAVAELEDHLHEHRKLKPKRLHFRRYNGVRKEADDFVLRQAGRKRSVTLATNVAGRGTDIVLDDLAKAAGGLHAIVGFLPENSRVHQQAIGRAARQGQPGSCREIISLKQVDKTIVSQAGADTSFENLVSVRDDRAWTESLARKRAHQFETICHLLQEDFFHAIESFDREVKRVSASDPQFEKKHSAAMEEIRHGLEQEWSKFFSGLRSGTFSDNPDEIIEAFQNHVGDHLKRFELDSLGILIDMIRAN